MGCSWNITLFPKGVALPTMAKHFISPLQTLRIAQSMFPVSLNHRHRYCLSCMCLYVCLLLTWAPSVLGCELAWLSDVNKYIHVHLNRKHSQLIQYVTFILYYVNERHIYVTLSALLVLSLMDSVHLAMHFLSWLYSA